MTYTLAYETHPNNESRITYWKVREKLESLLERASACLGHAAIELLPSETPHDRNGSSLTFVPNSKPQPITCCGHAYARTGFGLTTSRRIMRSAGAMDRHDAKIGNYLFLTATLPGDTEEAKWGIANYSHLLINGLKAWLSKRLQDRKEFYVWEHQRRGALHFHYCIHCPEESIKLNIEKGFKKQWARLLDSVKSKFGIGLWGKWAEKPFRYRVAILQARVERVYKSVGAYMAGYLSGKGSKHGNDKKRPYFPKRWFGVSRPLSALVKTYTTKQIHHFESFKETKEIYHSYEEDFLEDVLTHREYAHKVGEGRTHAFYHTKENQQKLWQAKQVLTHPPTIHPNIAAMIEVCLRATLQGQRLVTDSNHYKAVLSPKSYGYFEDSTFLVSMKRRAFSQIHLRNLMEAFTRSNLCIDSRSQESSFKDCLRRANNLLSYYYEQMRWNSFGWLNNTQDFDRGFDISAHGEYARTSDENRSVTGGGLEPSSHVDRDSSPPPQQMQLFS